MGRADNLSPMGLLNWDDTVFDLFQIPEELDRDILLNNLLAETVELEVIYPNPTVFKSLVGIWSSKQLPIWERLYATTQYEYNPIENYNRYETGSEDGTGRTTHSGTDTTADSTTYGGTDGRTEAIMQGGSDSVASQRAEGGRDTVTGEDTKGHWIAGFDATASGNDDGLKKQTRDQDDSSIATDYGKTESGNETTTFGKTENVAETKTYGQTINRAGNMTHGEQVATTSEGSHELHAHGNIGVTTTQKLIREQREVDKFNLYDIIIEEFKVRFCVLVY